MTEQVAVRLPSHLAQKIDTAVHDGLFDSRTAAVRVALELLFRELREQQIAESYDRAYSDKPQEEALGKASVELLRRVLEKEPTASP